MTNKRWPPCDRTVTTTRALLLAVLLMPLAAQEVVGKRQFSDQLVISEPFVEDELSLPTFLHIDRGPVGGLRSARNTSVGIEVKKRITPDFELSLAGNLIRLDRAD